MALLTAISIGSRTARGRWSRTHVARFGAEIVRQARQLDKDEHMIESFMLLGSWEVFHRLLALNPSLMDALRLCRHMH
jgi:hypothetical protein